MGRRADDHVHPGRPPVGTSAPPGGSKYVSQSGGSFTVSLTLKAHASGTQGMSQGAGGAGASVGPITITATTPAVTLTGTTIDNNYG